MTKTTRLRPSQGGSFLPPVGERPHDWQRERVRYEIPIPRDVEKVEGQNLPRFLRFIKGAFRYDSVAALLHIDQRGAPHTGIVYAYMTKHRIAQFATARKRVLMIEIAAHCPRHLDEAQIIVEKLDPDSMGGGSTQIIGVRQFRDARDFQQNRALIPVDFWLDGHTGIEVRFPVEGGEIFSLTLRLRTF